jgi:hypothetical protein
MPLHLHILGVIARLDRAIQYAAAYRFHRTVRVYWMPRLRGA